MAIHTQRHTYDPAEPLTPWVHAIARYKLIDFLRRNRAYLADVPIDEANELTAHDDHLSAESSFDLGRLLKQLPEKVACAIEAVKVDGLSVARSRTAVRHFGIEREGQYLWWIESLGGVDRPERVKMKTGRT